MAPGPYAFPRRERLTRKQDFEYLLRHGIRRVSGAYLCYGVRRQGQGRKFGLAVSRKVGGAVVRNRVKRMVREVYRLERPRLRDDVSLLIVARPASAKQRFHECQAEIRRLMRLGDALRD